MLREFLPTTWNNKLFGRRMEFGHEIDINDPDWVAWLEFYEDFYSNTQKRGLGKHVNDFGYKILSEINLDRKTIVEIGPGSLPHVDYWQGMPFRYLAVDVDERFLDITRKKLDTLRIQSESYLISRGEKANIAMGSVDVVLSFYSLEHLQDLDGYLSYFYKILKPGGLLVGAIPNEGGLAWGLGRYLTSRRFVKKHTNINYDKIICWEHPNYCDDIIDAIEKNDFKKLVLFQRPLGQIPFSDLNLVTSFVYKKN
ncbi:Methyltransferase domain protein [Rhodobacteraceae bacterium SB2]|nr:Methyltransferase domain protein [Rhodobacteraceae bacterium SB2]